ncbi:MAG TPA: LLM class flavin-dependent oxidoreductase, partial [Candidatus Limnocylindrales bacterium]
PIQPGGPKILVGGGGEQRTLKIAAKHADMTHWFPLGLEALQHKNEVLERHCEAIGRDPGTIERTVATPVLVASTQSDADAMLDRLPPERRANVIGGPPEKAAEGLRPYLDAGFTGFTFNNPVLRTPEAIGAAGELLKLIS